MRTWSVVARRLHMKGWKVFEEIVSRHPSAQESSPLYIRKTNSWNTWTHNAGVRVRECSFR